MFKHCEICFFVVHVVQHACTGVYLVVCAVCTGRQYKVAVVAGTIGLVGAIVPDLFVFDAEGPLGHYSLRGLSNFTVLPAASTIAM